MSTKNMLIAQLLCLKAQNVKRKPAPSKKKKRLKSLKHTKSTKNNQCKMQH